eukprot:4632348-Pleurochrysis_carterae.AAC.2
MKCVFKHSAHHTTIHEQRSKVVLARSSPQQEIRIRQTPKPQKRPCERMGEALCAHWHRKRGL